MVILEAHFDRSDISKMAAEPTWTRRRSRWEAPACGDRGCHWVGRGSTA